MDDNSGASFWTWVRWAAAVVWVSLCESRMLRAWRVIRETNHAVSEISAWETSESCTLLKQDVRALKEVTDSILVGLKSHGVPHG